MRPMRLRVLLSVCLLLVTARAGITVPCSPANYTKITDTSTTGLPADFCAYTYLPWRVKLPEPPAHIDADATANFQNYYAANSGSAIPSPNGANYISTSAQIPANANMSTGNHPVYHASASDPLITFPCAEANYGCSDDRGLPLGTTPALVWTGSYSFHIPPYARLTSEFCNGDKHGAIIQPDGTVYDLMGCFPPNRNWLDGDVLTRSFCAQNTQCSGGPEGLAITDMAHSSGTNGGNINTGDAMAALPATYQEVVVNGAINHALHVFFGCGKGTPGNPLLGRWPATYALPCSSTADQSHAIDGGSHIYLDLTHAQIDQISQDHPTWIPPYLKVFAYAAHDHGMFPLDTGGGTPYITQPMIEDNLPLMYATSGAQGSPWAQWFTDNGGGWGGNGLWVLGQSVGQFLDWKNLAPYMKILDPCYVRGTCSDSIPEGAATGAITYYIAPPPAGLDGNDCNAAKQATTAKAHFQGTQGVLACLQGGDKLIVQDGTYAEGISDGVPSGQSGAPTVIQAAHTGMALLTPTTLPSGGTAIVNVGPQTANGKHFITVDGLTLDGSSLPTGQQARGVAVGTASGTGSSDLVFTNLEVKNIPNHNTASCAVGQESVGVLTTGTDQRITLTKSHIHDIGTGATLGQVCSIGVGFASGSSTVDAVEVDHCQGAALCRGDAAAPAGSQVIRNSFFHDTGGSVGVACGTTANQFYNNILAAVGRWGLAPAPGALVLGGTCAGQTSSGNLLYNNTIYNSAGSCVQIGTTTGATPGPSNTNTIQNTLCWMNDMDAVTLASGTGNTVDHNLVTGSPSPVYGNPLFVTTPPVTAPDFQVQLGPPASPVIDQGVTTSVSGFTTDYGGNNRVRGAGQDVGAWESAGASTTAPPLAWWKFEEGTGTSVADATGNGHTLTLSSGVGWGPGKVGSGALKCQGNTGRATTPALAGLDSYSWTMWIQGIAQPVTTTLSTPFVNGNYAQSAGDAFGFAWDHSSANDTQTAYHHNASNVYNLAQIPTPLLSPNTWYHVALTFESGANTMRLYVNGAASTVVPNAGALTTPTDQLFLCGQTPTGSFGYAWSGLIDELKIWSRTLTANEVQTEYSGQGAGAGHRVAHRVTTH